MQRRASNPWIWQDDFGFDHALAMALAPLLQIRAIRVEGNSDSVSAGQWVVWTVGFSLWLAYGISTTDWPIIVTNVVALTMGLTTLTFVIRYRTRPQSAKPSSA